MTVKVLILSDFIPEALLAALSPESVQTVIEDVMDAARSEWVRLAGERLHSSRRDYVNGIQAVVQDGSTTSISLVGAMAIMREEGAGPFDMHDTLLGPDVPLAGPGQPGKHQNAEGGFYRSIPFRHQTPGSSGQAGGAPMGSAYAGHALVEDARKLGNAVYAQAKKLAPSIGMPGEGMAYGGRLPAGLAPKLKEHHVTDIYAGMIKQSKAYENAVQNTYTTFRTISDSKPDSWHHPGVEAANISDDVMRYVENLLPLAIGALVDG